MASEAKFLWKTSPVEQFFYSYTVSYQLSFASKEPLLEEYLRRTLKHLFRKVPPLRSCYGQREGSRWVKEMQTEIIDFEVLADTTIEEVHRKLLNYHYDIMTGPLWCVRLLPGDKSEDGIPGFPYVNTLFLGLEHGFTDGCTNMKICGFLAQLLSDVIAGKNIKDEEQLGVFVSGERTQKLVEDRIRAMKNDVKLKEKMLDDFQNESLFVSQGSAKGEEGEAQTCMLTWDLDEDTTSTFIKKCRAESVTVNSAFTALSNVAMVDILVEGGLQQDAYKISSNHVVNARRFWESGTSSFLGCHALPTNPVVALTPRNVEGNFWEYARLVHREFEATLKNGKALDVEALKQLCRTENPDAGAMSQQSQFDFCVTNMGDVTKLVTEGGEHVQVTHVLRCTALHNVPNLWAHYLHTFRGRLINVLGYSTANINAEMARKFNDAVLRHLKEAIV